VNPANDIHCSQLDPSSGNCTVCNAGYQVVSGACAYAYCAGTVVNCPSGFTLINGACGIPNCASSSAPPTGCTSCNAGYVLYQIWCIPPTPTSNPWCIAYSGGACTTCSWGYYVDANGYCNGSPTSVQRCVTYNMYTSAC